MVPAVKLLEHKMEKFNEQNSPLMYIRVGHTKGHVPKAAGPILLYIVCDCFPCGLQTKILTIWPFI